MRAYRNSNYRNRGLFSLHYLSIRGIQSPLTGAGGTGQGRSTISIGTGQAFIYCRWHISLIKRVGNGYLSIGSVYWLDPTHLIRCLVRLTYRLAWSSRPPIPQLLLVQLDIGVNPASPIRSNQGPIQLLSTIYPEPRGGTRRHRFGGVGLTGVYIGRSGTRVSSEE